MSQSASRSQTIRVVGFWMPEGEFACFSNWYPVEFDYARKHFTSIEQYMMYQKVAMFRQHDLASQIMATDDPAKCKKLGRTKFPEFDSAVWDKTRMTVVKRGVKAKFRQNELLLEKLLATGSALLAECSPYDEIWGIGVSIDDPAHNDVGRWKGRNLLGRILMEVREELGQERAVSPDGGVQISKEYFSTDIPEWDMRPYELSLIPQYHQAIYTYGDTLPRSLENAFYFGNTLVGHESTMRTNMGGGLPVAGFYEMKQDVYETARYLRYGFDGDGC